MRILVYGGKGWIGQLMTEYMDKHLEAGQKEEYILGKARTDDVPSLEKEIQEINPSHVLCLVGRTHGIANGKEYTTIDYLEVPGKLYENLQDNLFSQMVLTMLAAKYNYRLYCIATGCIYEYDDNDKHPFGEEVNGFREDSLPNFFGSSYSIVKGFADRLINLHCNDASNNVCYWKIRMPISSIPDKRNFITKIVNYEKICSIPNSMTILDDMIPVMVDMMRKNITGVFNMCNKGLISHNEILEGYRSIINPSFEWKNFTADEQREILLGGRSNNFMDTDKLYNLYPELPTIKEGIQQVLSRMKTYIVEDTDKDKIN